MSFDDAFTDPETKTGAPGPLRREEWVEDLVNRPCAHSRAAFSDRHDDTGRSLTASPGLTTTQVKLATVRQRIDSVADQIVQDLFESLRPNKAPVEMLGIDPESQLLDSRPLCGRDSGHLASDPPLLQAGERMPACGTEVFGW